MCWNVYEHKYRHFPPNKSPKEQNMVQNYLASYFLTILRGDACQKQFPILLCISAAIQLGNCMSEADSLLANMQKVKDIRYVIED